MNWIFNKSANITLNKVIVVLLILLATQWVLGFVFPVDHQVGSLARAIVVALALLIILVLLVVWLIEFFAVSQRICSTINHLIRARFGVKRGAAPDSYIRALFDNYAERFEDHLVNHLGYNVPEQMDKILNQLLDTSIRYKTLDLGCGTGLCAKTFKKLTSDVVGVDLSPAMLTKAEQTGLYAKLICKSLLKVDEDFGRDFDLVVAADVLIYFGDLDEVFLTVANVLKSGGYFIFSLERCEGDSWKISKNGRYQHSPPYVCELAEQVGFVLIEAKTDIQRWEAEKPVLGEVYLFQRC
jgi:predicted TPR repeat methyltransferase